jgi:hypothetical protein
MAAPGTCALCGKPLDDRRRRYCSTVCRDRARRQRTEAEASRPPAPERVHGDERGRQPWLIGAVLLLAALAIYILKRR